MYRYTVLTWFVDANYVVRNKYLKVKGGLFGKSLPFHPAPAARGAKREEFVKGPDDIPYRYGL